MQLLKRIGFYMVGVALGTLAVAFFWKNKKVTFDYGMDARTLKSIRIKKRLFSEEAQNTMQLHKIDTAQISYILKKGDVSFGKSKPRKRPCAEYYVTSEKLDLYVIRCDSTATIDKVFVK
ncbi:hypothetical protein EV195_103142 [Tenacibaculum skagerrakense]|uniref:DUF4258 domain-containing protein n=1 Tax=Tenacibaculum skagerrakense TaxID=186571 RepID=A0A4R2NV02_9FLAO|nr:DUF4258 domain-containing protein [Tenacibaculum skagerrakense]TCP25782.1 hypothetical protein EV195_103142 [Tenacibaculum skagerrakense]